MKSVIAMSMIALAALANQVQAGDHGYRCDQCGCGVKMVCRLKCEMKDVTTYNYCSKCEDFCMPAPSKCCGWKWVCDCRALCGEHKEHIWQPRCGHVCHRKQLVKVPVTKKVPVYTCEVVCICGACGCARVDEAATAEARANQIMPVSAEEPLVLEDNILAPQTVTQMPEVQSAPAKKTGLMARALGE